MACEIATTRGIYSLSAGAPLEETVEAIVLTLAVERADGIERILLNVRIERGLLGAMPLNADALIDQLRPWIEREFESTREAALKSIRAERRLHEVRFDSEHPGPLRV
jgi:hypothetical protein